MTLKLTKILVNPLKKMARPQTIWNIILSFCIKILQKSCKYWKQLQKVCICFHCEKPYCGCCVHSSSISVTAKFASWIALQKAPFKMHPSKFHFHFFAWNENRMYVQSVVTQLASMIDFYHFFREKRLWKIVAALSLSMEFSSRREQPFTRFQSNHVWEIWSSAIL